MWNLKWDTIKFLVGINGDKINKIFIFLKSLIFFVFVFVFVIVDLF
jgi:hypothetical protein